MGATTVSASEEVESLKEALEEERDAIKRQSFALRSLPEDYEYLQQEVQKLSEGEVFGCSTSKGRIFEYLTIPQ